MCANARARARAVCALDVQRRERARASARCVCVAWFTFGVRGVVPSAPQVPFAPRPTPVHERALGFEVAFTLLPALARPPSLRVS